MPKKNLLILKRQITRTIHYVNIFKLAILEVIGKGTNARVDLDIAQTANHAFEI